MHRLKSVIGLYDQDYYKAYRFFTSSVKIENIIFFNWIIWLFVYCYCEGNYLLKRTKGHTIALQLAVDYQTRSLPSEIIDDQFRIWPATCQRHHVIILNYCGLINDLCLNAYATSLVAEPTAFATKRDGEREREAINNNVIILRLIAYVTRYSPLEME